MMEEGSENLALDLQDIRLMLEPETCAIVARGATPEQIDQMQAYCDEVTRLIEAEEDYSAADAKFHRYLAECSGNHVLPNLIPIIASAIGVVITVTNDEHRSQSGMNTSVSSTPSAAMTRRGKVQHDRAPEHQPQFHAPFSG